MKTSEFVNYVNENWFATWEHGDNVIDIAGIMKVHTNRQLIEFDKKIATKSNHFRLIEKAIEYAETPLEERKEEKKYWLKTHNSFNALNRHLIYSDIYHGFVLLGVNDESNAYIKAQFTQKEIDAMPFDTNFFIKEEVK